MKYEFKGGSVWNGIKITSTFYIHETERGGKIRILILLDSLNSATNFN